MYINNIFQDICVHMEQNQSPLTKIGKRLLWMHPLGWLAFANEGKEESSYIQVNYLQG